MKSTNTPPISMPSGSCRLPCTLAENAKEPEKLTESKTFKKCTISGAFTFTALDYATASNKRLQKDKTVREPIENSDEYLELKFYIDYSDGKVAIERKKEKLVVKKEKSAVKKKKRSVSAAGKDKKRSVSAAGKVPWRN
ncbi:unnamed protein product [Caenorhabditis brenneri]